MIFLKTLLLYKKDDVTQTILLKNCLKFAKIGINVEVFFKLSKTFFRKINALACQGCNINNEGLASSWLGGFVLKGISIFQSGNLKFGTMKIFNRRVSQWLMEL